MVRKILVRTELDNSIHINTQDVNMIKVNTQNVLFNRGEYYIYNGGRPIKNGEVDKNGYFTLKSQSLKNGYRYDIIVKLYLNGMKIFEKISYIIAYEGKLEIDNIPFDNIIRASKYGFNGCFKSSNDIVGLKSYQFFLYNDKKVLLHEYTTITDLRCSNTKKLIQYVKNLETDKTYYIKVMCVDIFDVVYETDLYKFTTDFIPFIKNQACGLINECHTGSVQINSSVRRLVFIGVDDWNYIADEEVDLTRNGYIYMAEGFNIDWDFNMEFYCRNIISNGDLIYLNLQGTNNYLRCWYDRNTERVYVKKKVGSWEMLYRSLETMYVEPHEMVKVSIKQYNGRIEIHMDCVLEPHEIETVVYSKQKVISQKETQQIL